MTTEVLEAQALLAGQSAQWAELYALVRVLTISEGKQVNIHTDSVHLCYCAYAGGQLQGQGLLPATGKAIKNKDILVFGASGDKEKAPAECGSL